MATRLEERHLLRDLEAYYSGLAKEYGRDAARGAEESGGSDEQPASRVRLRGTDTVPPLFGYQRELVAEFERVCSLPRGMKVGLLTLPTGAGKTRTAAVALLRLLTTGRARTVLWLAPTRELLEQATATLQSVWYLDRQAVDVDLVRVDLLAHFPRDVERGILFATPHMLAARLKKGVVPAADVVVFDEAHHVQAPVFRRALERVRRAQNTAVIGLSATPGRSSEEETERLVDFFGGRLLKSEQLGRDPIAVLQRRGVLARVAFREVPGRESEHVGGVEKPAVGPTARVERFVATVRLARRLARTSRVLVFAESVDQAGLLAAALRCEGIQAASVSARHAQEIRRDRLWAFEHGELAVMVNKQLLATGYDCPAVRHVILATSIGSPILFEQIVGRASRGPLVGGHARSTVWQFEDHLAAHGLPQSYYRYSDYDWR